MNQLIQDKTLYKLANTILSIDNLLRRAKRYDQLTKPYVRKKLLLDHAESLERLRRK